ncbi:MAG: MFS transporter [Myxococcales bacterium]|nr:MFS transporter [Myxococcales bacterium]
MLISTAALMLCERFGFSPADALHLLGIASAANYVGSLPGGYLLDQTTDPRRGLGVSSLILLFGYTILSLPYRPALYAAFVLLFIGHSVYKPSTQRILAALYATGDSRLEGAQVLIHLTANIGATGGSLLAGIITLHAGWSVTYACAALIMSVACALLWPAHAVSAVAERSPVSALEQTPTDNTPSMPQHTRTIAGLALAMFLFTLSTAQAEGALLLWSKDRIDRVVLGFEVPIAWFLAFPALLVLVLAPIQLALLPRLKSSISPNRLVALGLVAASLCFAVLLPTTLWSGRVSMVWLTASLSLFVLAELLVAPLGLALLIRSTPPRFVGLVTGLWYGAGALGYFIGGEIGALWSSWPTRNVLLFLTALPAVGAVVFPWLTRNRPLKADRIAP